MTAYDKAVWEKRISNASGSVRINTLDAWYETHGELYASLRNDLLTGVKEFVTFPSPLGGEVILRLASIESIVWKDQAEMQLAYDSAEQESVLGD